MQKEDKREAILAAALALFAEQGFHNAPCAQIAQRAGVAAGTIYRYFESKDVLIGELYHEIERSVTNVVLPGYNQQATCCERFSHMATVILRYFTEHPQAFKYIEQFHHSPYGVTLRRDRMLSNHVDCGIYAQLFTEGMQKKAIKDLPIIILFDLAFGPIMAVARNHTLGFITLTDELINHVIQACWHAISTTHESTQTTN